MLADLMSAELEFYNIGATTAIHNLPKPCYEAESGFTVMSGYESLQVLVLLACVLSWLYTVRPKTVWWSPWMVWFNHLTHGHNVPEGAVEPSNGCCRGHRVEDSGDFVRPSAPWWNIGEEKEKRSDIPQRSPQYAPKGERKDELGQLCVKMTTGKTITLSIGFTGDVPVGTVTVLKAMIWEKEGVPCDQQCIRKGNATMEDGHPLQEYNIHRGETLHVLLRIRGGGRGGSAPCRRGGSGAYGKGSGGFGYGKRMQAQQKVREKYMQQREAEVQEHLHDAQMLYREAKVQKWWNEVQSLNMQTEELSQVQSGFPSTLPQRNDDDSRMLRVPSSDVNSELAAVK